MNYRLVVRFQVISKDDHYSNDKFRILVYPLLYLDLFLCLINIEPDTRQEASAEGLDIAIHGDRSFWIVLGVQLGWGKPVSKLDLFILDDYVLQMN